jgi:hypothetical protein
MFFTKLKKNGSFCEEPYDRALLKPCRCEMTESDENKEQGKISSTLSTIRDYMRVYAHSLDDNDQKAIRIFRQYEPQQKLRRLQDELILVKGDRILENSCDQVIGKKRKGKYHSYSNWASLMLQWMSGPKK